MSFQNKTLNSVYQKSEAGQIPVEEQLDEFELMVLAYLGDEPATGIPNVARAPVKPGEEDLFVTPALKVNRTSQKPRNYVKEAKERLRNGGIKTTAPINLEVSSSTNLDAEGDMALNTEDPAEDNYNLLEFHPGASPSQVQILGKEMPNYHFYLNVDSSSSSLIP